MWTRLISLAQWMSKSAYDWKGQDDWAGERDCSQQENSSHYSACSFTAMITLFEGLLYWTNDCTLPMVAIWVTNYSRPPQYRPSISPFTLPPIPLQIFKSQIGFFLFRYNDSFHRLIPKNHILIDSPEISAVLRGTTVNCLTATWLFNASMVITLF